MPQTLGDDTADQRPYHNAGEDDQRESRQVKPQRLQRCAAIEPDEKRETDNERRDLLPARRPRRDAPPEARRQRR